MRIVVVSTYYSANMGYTENCLPAALARLGHEVHVLTSQLNVYGNAPDYDKTYAAFLGPAVAPVGAFAIDGYTVHRLPYREVAGYIGLRGMRALLARLAPDVVHSTAVASLAAYELAALRTVSGFRLFTECHQHLSVVQPYMREPGGRSLKHGVYWLTRTVPASFVGRASEKCYAVAPDCAEVAERLYGVPADRIRIQSLGTDTVKFRPATTAEDAAQRAEARAALGYGPDEVVCLYTGRLSGEKNPLVFARAVASLAAQGRPFHALVVGEGVQREEILACAHVQVRPFMPHDQLPALYRMADIAVWPRQESMSMLDAAASGLPIVVSDAIGERERVEGNGAFYREDDVDDLARALAGMADPATRARLGAAGRHKMQESFSWDAVARGFLRDYQRALGVAA